MISNCLDVNSLGNLTIGGLDTVALAEQYGTPLYVMDEGEIHNNCQSYMVALKTCYEGNGMIAYASKAFNCKYICDLVNKEGMGIDVVSAGELFTAQSVGFPANKIIFHGNNKTVEELVMALEYGVGRIVVDNISELRLLGQLALSAKKTAGVLLRIKPGVDAHTHDFIRTGQIDSKFGFALETGEALEAVKLAVQEDGINLLGLHCHIGSQIFDIDPFVHAADIMIHFMSKIKHDIGVELKELNLGGGFGIKYISENDPVSYQSFMEQVSIAVKTACQRENLALPFLIFEPGRSIVGSAGITLYKVGAIKEIPNVRTYISVDGGMFDNPRYALYHSQYTFTIANKASLPRDSVVTVAGKCCESGDLLGEHISLQQAQLGDTLAVLATGAYNYSMSSNYNRNLKPAVVMVKNGKSKIIVKRETLQDIIRNDSL